MNLLKFLESPGGKLSAMRVGALGVVVLVLCPRLIIAIKTGSCPQLSWEEVTLVLGALGVKAYQRGKEDGEATVEPDNRSEVK